MFLENGLDSLAVSRINLRIIVEQDGLVIEKSQNSIRMTHGIVRRFGDENALGAELILQAPMNRLPFAARVLLPDRIGQDDSAC